MTRLLTILAVTSVVLGCRPSSQCPSTTEFAELKDAVAAIDEKIAGLTERLESTHSAKHALAEARKNLEAKDYDGAYDFILTAIRINPSAPEVFDAALDFARRAAQSGDDAALDLADDVYVRAAGLIPFQAVSDIPRARKEYLRAGQVFEESATSPPPVDPLKSIQDEILAIKNDTIPHDIAALVAQRIRSELESVGVEMALEGSASKPGFSEQWNDLKSQLEQLEKDILTKLYLAAQPRFAEWEKKGGTILERLEGVKPAELEAIGREIVSEIHTGYRLRSELLPFVESGVVPAKRDQEELDKRLELLERTREWIHNQHALATIVWLNDQRELAPFDRLKRLAQYDERRFSPYVLKRYQDAWEKWFNELDEENKVEATKLRILRELFQ